MTEQELITLIPNYPFEDGEILTYNDVNDICEAFLNTSTENDSVHMIPIEYSDLVSLVSTSGLTPGIQYRLIDYECTVANDTNARAINTGHFDIILVADDESTLNENVRFIQHSGDTYFSNCKLESWEGKYSIDNDTNKFAWADDSTNGKGVIYWLKDEWNNECPYDFKNIQFKRIAITDIKATGLTSDMLLELQTTFVYVNNGGICYGQVNGVPGSVSNNSSTINYTFDNTIQEYYYTFTWVDENNVVQDASIFGQQLTNSSGQRIIDSGGKYLGVFNNQIQPVSQSMFYSDSPNEFGYSLNNIVFVSSYSYNGGAFYGCYGNKFGVNCHNNTFGNDCYYNTFENRCYRNTFGNYCYQNTFGNNCSGNTLGYNCFSNTFGNYCDGNTFGNQCDSNTFGNNCDRNIFGNNCYQNTFGNDCTKNTFGNYCNRNTFGNQCDSNTFGNSCVYNTFGNDCNYNIFGDGCSSNTFGNECSNNTFRNSCDSNSFGNSCEYNTFGNNFEDNTFGNNCNYNTFGNDYIEQCRFDDGVKECIISGITTGPNNPLKNYHFLSNVTSYTLPSDSLSNINYQLVVGRKSDGTIIMVNPMD